MRLALFLVLILSCSCAVPIKNERIYGDLGSAGALYFETLTTASGAVDKATWDQMRIGFACMSAESFGDFKSEIEKLCSTTSCSYELTTALNRMQANLAKIQP